MSLVKVQKGQVTLPTRLRAQAGVEDGDVLEARLEHGKIVLIPKSITEQQIAESMEDYRAGRFHGPYTTAKEAMAALQSRAKAQKR